ncbi:MAG: Na(+)-translocating NADH-quinone reductase subunit A [Mesonia hippocampi]|uniref:Na(+)-translocating NADH-quinone reductase subunit A n=1 Tax=Mesonia hippocampi TaxID=1628250 RepID=UPI003F950E52
MSNDIKIKKGLDIKLVGEAEKSTENAASSAIYTIRPEDFHGILPRLIAKEGTKVKAGETVFFNKNIEEMKFVSPVAGEVVEVERGERRRIMAVRIKADAQQETVDHGALNVASADAETIKARLLASGGWVFIKQRPYDVIANPEKTPKAIFISGYASAPLAADYDYVLQGKEKQMQVAVDALSKLTTGKVHVSVGSSKSPMANLTGVTMHKVSGPHPVGNVGTQINKIDPVNKGETVWTITPQDLVILGDLLLTGKFNPERIIALAGSEVKKPRYFKTKIGADVASIIYNEGVTKGANVRVISGNVLTGRKISAENGNLDYYNNMITVIPEGDHYELFGWNKPITDKVSTSRAMTFSWLSPNKKYKLSTNTNGEHRAFVLTGIYEEVFPLDMFPMQMLKSCLYKDLDEMEALGMYEVAPEDFALTEFVCVSKQPHQQIIREGLDLMIKEIG